MKKSTAANSRCSALCVMTWVGFMHGGELRFVVVVGSQERLDPPAGKLVAPGPPTFQG
ncbi:MAG: hypothetical protein L0387_07050 [Acidobacteria bacterium]|nr:hypothetical protein [Acidobacteriota bacterium]MCI0621413.1 hypothetical protein [Acidobacteriota bacterium]MCI0724431.1 hypothetical protein [Acidobacteriota bacterium]